MTSRCPDRKKDGIDHHAALIYLWLNPKIDVTSTAPGTVNWELGINGDAIEVQPIYVAWLKGGDR
jgi:hypothetical protein